MQFPLDIQAASERLPRWAQSIGRQAEGYTLNSSIHFLLRLLAAHYRLRPQLRKRLSAVDLPFNMVVGFVSDDHLVAQTVYIAHNRIRVKSGLATNCDAVMRLRTNSAVRHALKSTPEDLLHLLLAGDLVFEGDLAALQLFNFLVSEIMTPVSAIPEPSTTNEGCDQPSAGQLDQRQQYHLRGPAGLSGTVYLDDPYLSDYTLKDFPRLHRFLDQHLSVKAALCAERATILTNYYREKGFGSLESDFPDNPLVLAEGLRRVLTRKQAVIRDNDLLAGTTTRHPVTGGIIFPEAQGCMIWGELNTIASREKIPFALNSHTREELHHNVFPFWARRNFREWSRSKYGNTEGQRIGDRWFAYFNWKTVGISHTIPDFASLLAKGTQGLRQDLTKAMAKRNPDSDDASQLQAMMSLLLGVESYADHLADEAQRLADAEKDPKRSKELNSLAKICRRVPRKSPRNLHEALQSLWTMWIALHQENTDTGLSIGRLDQLLQPWFARDMSRLRKPESRQKHIKKAVELCGCFFLRLCDHFPVGPDIANFLFGGASSTQAVTLGGITPDGKNAVNDMSWILIKVTEMLALRDVNVNARVDDKVNNRAWLTRLGEVNLLTAGTPSMHNDEAVIASLTAKGYPLEDARDWSATGCVEPTISGQHSGHTGSILFNLVAPLEMALRNGYHPVLGEQAGPKTGAADSFNSFEQFFSAWQQQFEYLASLAATYNNQLADIHANHRPNPLLSVLTRGCLATATDVTRGGARYNSSGTSNIGLADISDSLLAIRHWVFEKQVLTLPQLLEALENNFEGSEPLRRRLAEQTKRFGSGDADAIALTNRVATVVHRGWGKLNNFRGGTYTSGFWSMSQHVAYGTLSGALPNGRLAGKAFTPGLTPWPGASGNLLDNLHAAAQLDPVNLDNNMAFNVKLTPRPGEDHSTTVGHVQAYVESYFNMGGMQMQFNMVDSHTLRDAMDHPEQYRHLLVRISGYNAYFTTLDRRIQMELIERAEFAL